MKKIRNFGLICLAIYTILLMMSCGREPGSDSYVDNCDTCDSDSSNDCVQDCAGTWGGSLVDDECGICGGDNTSCADCAGVPNGDNVEDNCGICSC